MTRQEDDVLLSHADPAPGHPEAAVLPENWYGFTRVPFHVTPDSAMIFTHRRYEEALSALHYGVSQGKGFVVITGEVGSGKTTLLRHFISLLDERMKVGVIFNTGLGAEELLEAVADDLGITRPASGWPSRKAIIDAISEFLLKQFQERRSVAVFIDEAQNLSIEALECLRMLSNLETEAEKLLQIVLFGQPELQRLLASPELLQLRSRVAVTYHMMPMDLEETETYIAHRIRLAEPTRPVHFLDSAVRALHAYSGGLPRIVNIICDQALLAGANQQAEAIDERIIESVIGGFEFLDRPAEVPAARRWALPILAALISAAALFGAFTLRQQSEPPPANAIRPVPGAPAAKSPMRRLLESYGVPAQESVDQMRLEAIARSSGMTLLQVSVRPATAERFGLPALLMPGNPILTNTAPAVLSNIVDGVWTIETMEKGRIQLTLRDGEVPLSYLVPARPYMMRRVRRGNGGEDVLAAQKVLHRAGLLTVEPNGHFGPNTEMALAALYEKFEIDEGGWIGPRSMLALASLERR